MTDDIRDTAASDEAPDEETPDAAEAETPENAPTADEPVDWEKRYKEREKTLSRQGAELALLRREVEAIRSRASAPQVEQPGPEDYAALPPAIQQELSFYRARLADVERTEIAAEYGDEFAGALDYFQRAASIDPSRKGLANALVATINRLASTEEEKAPEPAKPKAPTRMETNRPDNAPPADIEKIRREAEKDPSDRNRARFIGAIFDRAGISR